MLLCRSCVLQQLLRETPR